MKKEELFQRYERIVYFLYANIAYFVNKGYKIQFYQWYRQRDWHTF